MDNSVKFPTPQTPTPAQSPIIGAQRKKEIIGSHRSAPTSQVASKSFPREQQAIERTISKIAATLGTFSDRIKFLVQKTIFKQATTTEKTVETKRERRLSKKDTAIKAANKLIDSLKNEEDLSGITNGFLTANYVPSNKVIADGEFQGSVGQRVFLLGSIIKDIDFFDDTFKDKALTVFRTGTTENLEFLNKAIYDMKSKEKKDLLKNLMELCQNIKEKKIENVSAKTINQHLAMLLAPVFLPLDRFSKPSIPGSQTLSVENKLLNFILNIKKEDSDILFS